MTIRAYRYSAEFKLVRNFKFRRCTDSNSLIWPFQKVYNGTENMSWPIRTYWLSRNQYLILKIQDMVYGR